MNAKNFLDDEDGGEVAASGGRGAIGRHLSVAHWNFYFACFQALGISGDGLGTDGADREGKARGKRRDDEAAAGEIGFWEEAESVGVHGSDPWREEWANGS